MVRRALSLAVALLTIAVCYRFVDKPVLFYLAAFDEEARTPWRYLTLLGDPEVWLAGSAILWLLSLVVFRRASRALLYFTSSLLTAYALANFLKFLLGRFRPAMLISGDAYGFSFLTTERAMNSLPSGHAVAAMAAAVAAGYLAPKWRILFVALALLIALSRVVILEHYASDVLAGAYIGWAAAILTRDVFIRRGLTRS